LLPEDWGRGLWVQTRPGTVNISQKPEQNGSKGDSQGKQLPILRYEGVSKQNEAHVLVIRVFINFRRIKWKSKSTKYFLKFFLKMTC